MTSSILTSKNEKAFKLLFRSIAVILVSAALLDVAGRVGEQLSDFRVVGETELSHVGKEQVDYITIGTSHARPILPSGLGGKVLPLWSGGQSLMLTLDLLNYFKPELSATKAKAIILPVSKGVLLTASTKSREFNEEEYNVLVRFNLWRAIRTIPFNTLDNYVKGFTLHIAREDNWGGVAKSLLYFRTGYHNTHKQPPLSQVSASGNPFDPEKISRTLGNQIEMISNADDINFERQKGLRYLEKIAEKSHALGACLILVETPVSYPYRQALQLKRTDLDDWKEQVRSLTNKMQKTACVHFLEDMMSVDETKKSEYYLDPDHLNVKGGEIFSARIRAKLKSIGLVDDAQTTKIKENN